MSLADYTGLKNSISKWLHRADLDPVIPDFIRLLEARCNRNLRVRQMEKRVTEAVASGTAALPADWLEFSQAPYSGARLDHWSRDAFDQAYGLSDYGNYYTIIGNSMYLGTGQTGGSLRYDYYAKIPPLSEANATNWLLLDAPDVYLYGALLEAEPYLKNDGRIAVWQGFLQVALTDLQGADDRARFSGGTLSIGLAQ